VLVRGACRLVHSSVRSADAARDAGAELDQATGWIR
jgi:hypothetical protein